MPYDSGQSYAPQDACSDTQSQVAESVTTQSSSTKSEEHADTLFSIYEKANKCWYPLSKTLWVRANRMHALEGCYFEDDEDQTYHMLRGDDFHAVIENFKCIYDGFGIITTTGVEASRLFLLGWACFADLCC